MYTHRRSDIGTAVEPSSSLFSIGTKVAKQFDGADGELVWFEGEVQRYDKQDDLYWILYGDGDSEDMDASEVRDAVDSYRVHRLQEEAESEAETATAGSTSLPTTVDTAVATSVKAVGDALPTTVLIAADSSHSLAPPELAVAVQAMTAAAERLASAAARIEAAVQTQHATRLPQPQVQQQQWQQHRQWQQQLQWQQWQQQQQQQLRLAYYQQRQLMYWPQQQQQ